MERQIPKNVRQIGNVSNTPKIYVEDYVQTFFSQLCAKTGDEPKGAFLVGDIVHGEKEEYVYIYGAVQMHGLQMAGTEYIIDEETWKYGYEDCKQYFEDGEMLGWFVAQPGVPDILDAKLAELHKKSFPKENTVFILANTSEKEENYYVMRYGQLMEMQGHYIYYEKNPYMQNYMISSRKKNGVNSTETVSDRAMKDFRSIVQEKSGRQHVRKSNRFIYRLSAVMLFAVVIMGTATMKNISKMKDVQNTISEMNQESSTDLKTPETVETMGKVTGEEKTQESNLTETEDQAVYGQSEEDTGNETIEMAQGDNAENGTDGIYIVEQGDTLAIISQKMYGDLSHVDNISKMNGLSDGNLIYVGQKLILP